MIIQTPDLPARLGRDYGVPQDSRDEALDRAARNRSSADRTRGAVKAVIADIWTRRFVERNLKHAKQSFHSRKRRHLLTDHQVGAIAWAHSFQLR